MAWKLVRDLGSWKLWVNTGDKSLRVSVVTGRDGSEVRGLFHKVTRSFGRFKSVNDAVARAKDVMDKFDAGEHF